MVSIWSITQTSRKNCQTVVLNKKILTAISDSEVKRVMPMTDVLLAHPVPLFRTRLQEVQIFHRSMQAIFLGWIHALLFPPFCNEANYSLAN